MIDGVIQAIRINCFSLGVCSLVSLDYRQPERQKMGPRRVALIKELSFVSWKRDTEGVI